VPQIAFLRLSFVLLLAEHLRSVVLVTQDLSESSSRVLRLDENIARKLRAVRLDLSISELDHANQAQKCRSLIDAIGTFLGDKTAKATPPQNRGEYGWLTDAIRGAILGAEYKTFTLENIETVLEVLGAPAERQAISVALWKMAERGELKTVERGSGRKPTIYKPANLNIVRYRRT
jgi:hypothetical protein